MGHKIIDTNRTGRFNAQIGEGAIFRGMLNQRGYGMQYGYGFGTSFLTKAWKYGRKHILPWLEEKVLPVAKEGLETLLSEGASAGSKALERIAKGDNVLDTIAEEGKTAVKNLARKGSQRLAQYGKGRRKKVAPRKFNLVGMAVSRNLATQKNRNKGHGVTLY